MAVIRPSEISEILRNEIKGFEGSVAVRETGRVLSCGDGIARIYGLQNAESGELLEFPHQIYGIVLNLEEDNVGAALFGDPQAIGEGDESSAPAESPKCRSANGMLGRVVNVLGQPIDDKGPIKATERRRIEIKAPGIIARQPVKEPLQTGIKAIDSMFQIGRGQRELIIGDREIGKTAIAIDTIINQRGLDVNCIYVAIGQKRSTVAQVVEKLSARRRDGLYDCRRGDRVRGRAVAVHRALQRLYDGRVLPRQRQACAAGLRRPVASTPPPTGSSRCCCAARPDARLTPATSSTCIRGCSERAAKMSDEKGGGSLTALPIIETQAGDVSAYIPTNVISITDGQIVLEGDLFYSGIRPAINVGLSVSRVGFSAAIKAMKQAGGTLKSDLAQYREMAAFAQFGSDLDASSQRLLHRGDRLTEMLKQGQYEPLPVEKEVLIIYAAKEGYLDQLEVEQVKPFEAGLYAHFDARHADLLAEIKVRRELSDDLKKKLSAAIDSFAKEFAAEHQSSAAKPAAA